MFETLIREITDRFGLGNKGNALLKELLALIFDDRTGGFSGFLAKFRQQGLGELFSSWIGAINPPPIDPPQLENALGSNVLTGIADRLGIARGTTVAAVSALLPKIIALLTRNGTLPTGVPAEVGNYLSGFGHLAEKTATSVRNAEVPSVPNLTPGLGWIKWVLLAAVLLALGYCMLHRTPETTTAPSTSESAAPTPAATIDPKLTLSNNGGKVVYSGQLGSAAEKTRLVDALNQSFGTGNVSGDIAVDPNTKSAGWLGALLGLLPDFLKTNGAKLDFNGDTITLGGDVSSADRLTLAGLLKSLFGGFTLKGLEPGALQSASDAFKALLPGKYSAAELINALNLMTIHFETGSASISADSIDVLNEAAAAIKNAPTGTRVEIGGHTDNTGDAATNLKLSDDRALAVRSKLIELGVTADSVSAKGYGDTKPVADNATEEGRARNRRMEFTVVE